MLVSLQLLQMHLLQTFETRIRLPPMVENTRCGSQMKSVCFDLGSVVPDC